MNKKVSTFGFVLVWLFTATAVGIIYFNQNEKSEGITFENGNKANSFYEKKVFTRHTKSDFENEELVVGIKNKEIKEKQALVIAKPRKIEKLNKVINDGFDIKAVPTN
jgi:hypothetical protein